MRGWGKVMCTKLEVRSVRKLKVNSEFLPQTRLLLDYFLIMLKEVEGGHHISCVFIELLVMQGTAKPESLTQYLMKLQL